MVSRPPRTTRTSHPFPVTALFRSDDGDMSRPGLARAAGLHATKLLDLDSPGWNPTAETLGKLESWLAHGSDLSPMASAEEIIAEARNGRMVILVDDEDRENEGHLIIPAQMATPDAINFMATHGRGLICLTLTKCQIGRAQVCIPTTNAQLVCRL